MCGSVLAIRVLEMRERELEVRDRFFGVKGEKEEKEKNNNNKRCTNSVSD